MHNSLYTQILFRVTEFTPMAFQQHQHVFKSAKVLSCHHFGFRGALLQQRNTDGQFKDVAQVVHYL